jgi:hypothetical protein
VAIDAKGGEIQGRWGRCQSQGELTYGHRDFDICMFTSMSYVYALMFVIVLCL